MENLPTYKFSTKEMPTHFRSAFMAEARPSFAGAEASGWRKSQSFIQTENTTGKNKNFDTTVKMRR
jgi:hypothetical protein